MSFFYEKQPWDWTNAGDSTDVPPDSFVVNYELFDENPTAGGETADSAAKSSGGDAGEQDEVVALDEAISNSPITPGSNVAPAVHWATPPSQHSEETHGGPLRFRTLSDLLDSTDEMYDYEYSGMCLLAVDELEGVDEALEHDCWVKAMNTEL